MKEKQQQQGIKPREKPLFRLINRIARACDQREGKKGEKRRGKSRLHNGFDWITTVFMIIIVHRTSIQPRVFHVYVYRWLFSRSFNDTIAPSATGCCCCFGRLKLIIRVLFDATKMKCHGSKIYGRAGPIKNNPKIRMWFFRWFETNGENKKCMEPNTIQSTLSLNTPIAMRQNSHFVARARQKARLKIIFQRNGFVEPRKLNNNYSHPNKNQDVSRCRHSKKKRTRLTSRETKSEQQKEKRIERRENTHRRELFFSK